MKTNPIIVALDVESADEARALVRRLGPHVAFYKVGVELYAAEGIAFVRELVNQGLDVFLDLKFYDIPETVRRAVAQVARTGVRFLTVPQELSRSELAGLEEAAKARGAKGLAYLVYDEEGEVRSPIAKFLSEPELEAFRADPASISWVCTLASELSPDSLSRLSPWRSSSALHYGASFLIGWDVDRH